MKGGPQLSVNFNELNTYIVPFKRVQILLSFDYSQMIDRQYTVSIGLDPYPLVPSNHVI